LALYGTSDDADPGVINRALLQGARLIDRHCGRFFSQDALAVARTYRAQGGGSLRSGYSTQYYGGTIGWAESENPYLYGSYSRILTIDDLAVAPTEVILDESGNGSFVGETALAVTDYELWPTTAQYGPEPKPWQQLYIPQTSNCGGFRAGMLVRITARWGWPAVPEPIVRANCELAATLRFGSSVAALTGIKSWNVDAETITYFDNQDSSQDRQAEVLSTLAAYAKAPLL
jgi:hypothetical protein